MEVSYNIFYCSHCSLIESLFKTPSQSINLLGKFKLANVYEILKDKIFMGASKTTNS